MKPVTKVKATVTVEVHADLPGCAEEESPVCKRQAKKTHRAECECSDSNESETSV